MNPPRRWPLDPRRKQALRLQPGRFAWKESHPRPTPPAARAWRQSMPPARYAPAAGTAKATCAATVRLRAGRLAPTSRTFTPSRAAPCRVPFGGLSRRRNKQASIGPSPFHSGADGWQKSGRSGGRARCRRPTTDSKRRHLRGCSGGGVDAAWHPARQLRARMGQDAKARVVRGIIQQLTACCRHGPQLERSRFHQARFVVSFLEVWNCQGVSARCAAGLSGYAPCRLCGHGHSASIPHA